MAVQKPMWEAASGRPERASTYSRLSVNRAEMREPSTEYTLPSILGILGRINRAALRNDPDRSRHLLERIPARRWGEPRNVAGCSVAPVFFGRRLRTLARSW